MLDWASRRALAWRVSNSLGADVAVAAFEEASAKYGVPEIMNTDQGRQPGLNWSSQHGFDTQSVALH